MVVSSGPRPSLRTQHRARGVSRSTLAATRPAAARSVPAPGMPQNVSVNSTSRSRCLLIGLPARARRRTRMSRCESKTYTPEALAIFVSTSNRLM